MFNCSLNDPFYPLATIIFTQMVTRQLNLVLKYIMKKSNPEVVACAPQKKNPHHPVLVHLVIPVEGNSIKPSTIENLISSSSISSFFILIYIKCCDSIWNDLNPFINTLKKRCFASNFTQFSSYFKLFILIFILLFGSIKNCSE